jgi:hypothetical protein
MAGGAISLGASREGLRDGRMVGGPARRPLSPGLVDEPVRSYRCDAGQVDVGNPGVNDVSTYVAHEPGKWTVRYTFVSGQASIIRRARLGRPARKACIGRDSPRHGQQR